MKELEATRSTGRLSGWGIGRMSLGKLILVILVGLGILCFALAFAATGAIANRLAFGGVVSILVGFLWARLGQMARQRADLRDAQVRALIKHTVELFGECDACGSRAIDFNSESGIVTCTACGFAIHVDQMQSLRARDDEPPGESS